MKAIPVGVADVVAGLSLAGLLLPEAVAYAGIANLPPQAGLLGLIAGILAYALFGSSARAVVGATSSSAAVLAASVHALAPANASAALLLASGLVLTTGFLFTLGALLQLGHLVHFIAKPVLRGFAFGLAVIITVKQLAKMAGIAPPAGNLADVVIDLFAHLHEWNPVGLTAGFVALGLLLLFSRVRYVPASLLVIIAGIAISRTVDPGAYGIAVVGPLQFAAVRLSVPVLDPYQWSHVVQLAVALTVIVFAESYTSIHSFANKNEPEATDRDLLALGMANLVAGLLTATPVGAGFSATSANAAAGAESKLAALCAVLLVLVTVGVFLPQIEATPEPVLAAIVIYAMRHSLTLKPLLPCFRWQRDRVVTVTAILGIFAFGIVNGMLLAIVVSVVMTIRNLSQPRLAVLGRFQSTYVFVDTATHHDASGVPGILILRAEEPLFFANVAQMLLLARAEITRQDSIKTVILSLEESPDLDATSLEELMAFADFVHARGYRLMLARIKDRVESALRRTGHPVIGNALFQADSVADCVTIAQETASHAAPT